MDKLICKLIYKQFIYKYTLFYKKYFYYQLQVDISKESSK